MWIEIKPEIFNSEINIDDLRKLIQDLCYKHRYEIFIDITKINNQEIFDAFSESNNEMIYDFYNKYVNENKDIKYFISNNILSSNYFSVSEAIIYFNLPLLIILENSNNDGYFIDALIREFKNKAKKIERFKNERWIKYGMGGGSENILHYILGELKEFNGNNKFLKCFVLIDSDLEYPQVNNKKRKKLIDFFKKHNIPYHILEKREIENYLPVDIFENLDLTNNFIKSYKKLSSIQKDYIDIQNGFQENKKGIEKKKPEVYNFYSDLSEKDFEDLRHGIKNLFENFKNDYPKLFEKATKIGLLERTNQQINSTELQDILNKINELL